MPPFMDLDAIFKAYDVRGVVPDELDAVAARKIGYAFARFAAAPRIAVGRDVRTSSPVLAGALIEGITAAGVDVDEFVRTDEARSVAAPRFQVKDALNAATCSAAARAAMTDAQPLKRNGYKVPLFEGVIEEALLSMGTA